MAIDVSPHRAAAEALMVDTMRFTRDPKGKKDATLDPDTLKLVGPGQPFEPTEVYEGKARIHPPRTTSPRTGSEGGALYGETIYTVSVPWNATEILPGDVGEVLSSARDTQLVDRTCVVREVKYHTWMATRQLLVELRA